MKKYPIGFNTRTKEEPKNETPAELSPTGKNHEFRKYHCQLAVEHYVSKGWEREKAEKYLIQRHLSHSSKRQGLKRIYLYS